MNQPISPSQIVLDSIGLAAKGTEIAQRYGHCAACGTPYAAGDQISPWLAPKTFTDFSDLANGHETHLCAACATLWTTEREFTQINTKVIASKEGLFPFFSNDAVAYWLLNPPPAPFVAFIGTQQIGHIVWKSSVTLDQAMFLVRYDDKLFRIRRTKLLAGIDAARLLLAKVEAAMPRILAERPARSDKKIDKKEFKVTFLNSVMDIDRNLERSSHGAFKPAALSVAAESPEGEAAVKTLQSLNAGELWGLLHILYAANPVRPEPKPLSISPKSNLTEL